MKSIVKLVCCGLMFAVATSAFATDKKKQSSAPAARPAKKKPLLDEADSSISGQGYGMAGCGLGSILFGDKPGMIQIVAATFNGTSGNQTFGISTGTSNCDASTGHSARSASLFITVNKEALAKDVSRGSGENLEHLASIMGCEDSKLLGSKLQKNYDVIFPSNGFSAEKSGQEVYKIIKTDSSLDKSCPHVG